MSSLACRFTALASLVVSCAPAPAAVVQLPPTASSMAPTTTVQGSVQACKLAWESCHRIVDPMRVSETEIGQSPQVVWTGHEALVTFETLPHTVHLVAVRLDGRVAWNEPLQGNGGHIAWNARTHAGLVVTSDAIVWLGADGRPSGVPTLAPKSPDVEFAGAPFATAKGFVIVSGVGGRKTTASIPPLSYAVVGSSPEAITWKAIDANGDRETPFGADDASNVASWILSFAHHATSALYPVSAAGEIGAAVPLALPDGARVATIASNDKDPLVLYGVGSPFELTAVRVRDGQMGPRTSLGARSQRSNSAVAFRVAGALVIGADKIAGSPGVAAARIDGSALTIVGAPLPIGEIDSQRLRVAATDQGFVAVWNIADEGAPLVPLTGGRSMHGLSTKLAVYDCCH